MLEHPIRFLICLDLGFSQDPTAIVILRLAEEAPLTAKNGDPIYVAAHMERHLKREYPDILEDLARMVYRAEMWGQCAVVIDGTGVGIPFTQQFRRHERIAAAIREWLTVIPIMITAGGAVLRKDGFLHVPKSLLVSTMHTVLGSKRLRVVPSLIEAKTLDKEFRNFQQKYTPAANVTFSAREGQHDDIVLAISVGLYVAETFRGTTVQVMRVNYT